MNNEDRPEHNPLLGIIRHSGMEHYITEGMPATALEMLKVYYNGRVLHRQIELVSTIATGLFINVKTELHYGKSDFPGSTQLTSEG